jgi:glycosyltransferase involved in cell wall biosynthesis
MSSRPEQRPVVFVTSSPAVQHPRHYHLLATGLARAGLPVVAMGQPERGAVTDGEVPVRLLPRRRGRAARMLSGPLTMRRVAREKPALVHVTCLDLLPWAVLLRALRRTPVLYDSNEDYASYMLIKGWVPSRLRPALSRAVGSLEPWLSGRLDGVTVADDGTAASFEGRARTLVVHNYPWLDFSPAAKSGTPEYDVLYHGSLPPGHVEYVAETARALAGLGVQARWCLAARDYGPEDERRLEERLQAAGVRDQFDLRYNLPFSEMPALVANARVGFIPLPDELKFHKNLPRKLFEYLATGLTCVASDLPPTRRLVEGQDCCVLVRPGDYRGYAEALAGLLADPARAAEMGARGRRLVLERWNAEQELQPYVELCRELAGIPATRAEERAA